MPDSIPQWITDIESDERIFKEKRRRWRAGVLSLFIIYFIGGFLLFYNKFYLSLFIVAIIVILVILLFINFL